MVDVASLAIKADTRDLDKAEKSLERLEKQSGKTERATNKLEFDLKSLADTAKVGLAVGITAVTAAGVKSLTMFADMERGLIGVQKTTDLNTRQMNDLENEFTRISRTVPVATRELVGMGVVAGQLGVKGVDNISRFTETMGKLQLATDIVGEEGAASIARLLNVTGDGIETVDEFGNVLVALGNTSAATESEILRLGTEVAQATSTFSVSSTEAIALGAAMRSMGVRAELGGSVTGRAMRSIEAAIESGGKEMETLSELTGIAYDDLEEAFGDNATEVFTQWLKGVGRMIDGGETAASVLDEFGLRGEEVLKVLPTMAVNIDQVETALRTEREELRKNNALNKEAQAASEGLTSKFQLVKNIVNEVGVEIGETLAPEVQDIIDDFTDWWEINDELIKQDIKQYIGGLIEGMTSLKGNVDKLLSVNDTLGGATWEWGIVGALLFKGQPGWAALVTGITVLNNNLEVFDLNLGSLVESSQGFGENIQNIMDVLTGKRDWQTGELKRFGEELEGVIETSEDWKVGEIIENDTERFEDAGKLLDELSDGATKYGETWEDVDKDRGKSTEDTNSDVETGTENTFKHLDKVIEDFFNDFTGESDSATTKILKNIEEIERQEEISQEYRLKLNEHFARQTTSFWEIQTRDREAVEARTTAMLKEKLEKQSEDVKEETTFMQQFWQELFVGIEDDSRKTYGELSKQFGDWSEKLVSGGFETIGDAWDELWQGMLGTMANVLGRMAADWAASKVSNLFKSWDWNVFHEGAWSADEGPAIIEDGEMIIPKDVSAAIRKNLGGFDGSFDSLVASTEMQANPAEWATDGRFGDIFASNIEEATVSTIGKTGLFGLMTGGLPSVAAAMKNFGREAIIGIATESIGFAVEQTFGKYGPQSAMNTFGSDAYGRTGNLFGKAVGIASLGGHPVTGLVSSILGVLGSHIGNMVGDMLDDREFEALRDAVEDGRIDPRAVRENLATIEGLEEMSGRTSPQRESTFGGFWGSIESAWNSVTDAIGGFFGDIGWGDDGGSGPGVGEPGGLGGVGGVGDVGGSRGSGDAGGTSSPGGVGGFAKGGITSKLLVPQGEDGFAAMKFNEGVIDADTMAILSKQIRSGSFGNNEILIQLLNALLQSNKISEQNSQNILRILETWDFQGTPPERTTI